VRVLIDTNILIMAICPIDRAVLESAFNSGLTDFEDAVPISSAVAQGLDAIVTRVLKGF
jgi:hypothetical protein